MATIKSYTDLEQSKKLAEILPLESADMDYIPITNIDGEYSVEVNEWDNEHIIEEGWIPCWSFAALLEIMPSSTLDSSDDHYYRVHCNEKFTKWYDNPVDACYEMILKLHELKML